MRPRDFTFSELFQTTCSTLVVTVENVYVHHVAYPEASVLLSVAASMTCQLVFDPVRALHLDGREPAGSWYVDGGVLDKYPLALFSNAGGSSSSTRMSTPKPRSARRSVSKSLGNTSGTPKTLTSTGA